MKKNISAVIGILLLGGALWAAVFYYQNLRGIRPALLPPKNDIIGSANSTGLPLKIADGFKISVFAKGLSGARVLSGYAPSGGIAVSQTSEGKIQVIRTISDGSAIVEPLLSGKDKPHGIAFDPQDPNWFYYATETGVFKVNLSAANETKKIADLPGGGGHATRTLRFGPDDRLFVSVGSSCNVCEEEDERRAKIYSMKKDGTDFKEFARGLRNAVFFTWSYVDGKMWATEMGRDLLGDDIPPDEINIIEEGKNYGWPICYGKSVHDTQFDKNTYIRDPCSDAEPSFLDLPAHSAPLGLAFIPEEGWPED